MPAFIEKNEQVTLPVVALPDAVAFPGVAINFEASDAESAAAIKEAGATGSLIFIVTYDPNYPESEEGPDYYRLGTVAKIKQMLRTPEGQTRLIAEGLVRASVTDYHYTGEYYLADLTGRIILLPGNGGVKGEAYCHEILEAVKNNARFLPSGAENMLTTARSISDLGQLADFIAANFLVRTADKQTVLECVDPFHRAELLIGILADEASVLMEEANIRHRVNARMNKNQREYYLREQIKVIQEELGEGNEVEEFAARIQKAELPKEVAEKLTRENERLAKTPYGSAEATVLANYLDTCLDIPWTKMTHDKVDFAAVQKVLDDDHYGLEKVKERIVEYIAAKQLSPELKGQIICLVGPPGVGKTSIAASIARAMNRKYVRISLGGVRDEADIRGHRKTYIGAMPGRIITSLKQAGVRNPLILLDEIDKLTRDTHGDPTSALLEVLDGEQNKSFRDHFVELPYDLSDCMFIATANTLDTIPRPLIDRMEIIELGIYTKREKLEIAKKYLVPKQQKRHGLNKRMMKITDEALVKIIDLYTREAGVRNLERSIATLCRKVGRELLEGTKKSVTVNEATLVKYLGAEKIIPERIEAMDEVGCVNGLAYTELGGSLLKVEVAILDGSGKIETTGSLGDVMKESAQLAVSYVRSVAKDYGIPTDFYKTKDIHIHFPEGAVPKDGPSAGVTMVTALISALTGYPVQRSVAMTGEISLRGNVLAIGGLKEKTMAAYNAGVTTVLIPADNKRDLDEIDPLAREGLRFIPCRKLSEVLQNALILPMPTGTGKLREAAPLAMPTPVPVNKPTGQLHCSAQHND